MTKKLKTIIALALSALACIIVASCSAKTIVDNYVEQGYKIVVTFNGNGGTFVENKNGSLIDLYNPSTKKADADGVVRFTITEPTERTLVGDRVTLVKSGYFVGGWYKSRTLKQNDQGELVDSNGNAIVEVDGAYYYKNADGTASDTSAEPAYDYDGYWDFASDMIEYAPDSGVYELTLYAGWVENFRFDYYFETENGWAPYEESTEFNYVSVNKDGSAISDYDTITLPRYEQGAMNYESIRADGTMYVFPEDYDSTFKAAYLDQDKTQEITTSSFTHQGTFDRAHCLGENTVQKIYITLYEGKRYRIETAADFVRNVNVNGYYEIVNDLDFTNVSWPNTFTNSPFNGTIVSFDGNNKTFSNITATCSISSQSNKNGGLFANLTSNATIKDLTFNNVTVTFSSVPSRFREAQLATFAGYIDENADVYNVKLTGALKMRLFGKLSLFNLASEHEINLIANGDTAKLDSSAALLQLEIYSSSRYQDGYEYNFDPEETAVDEERYSVTLSFFPSSAKKDHNSYLVYGA